MADGIKLEISGDRELQRAFGRLPLALQKKALRPALRKSVKRLHLLVIQAFSGFPVGVVSGNALIAIQASKVKSRSSKKGISVGFEYPEFDGFPYPWATIEYGSRTVAARAPMRKTADANAGKEQVAIMEATRKGVEKQWARLAR